MRTFHAPVAAKSLAMFLGLVRILICLWPQAGYVHPDEFFQSTDIVAGRQFSTMIQPVWEFTTDRPIRCMLFPSLLNLAAFKLVRLLFEPTAYLLLVAPRLAYTLAAFSIDYCLLLLCRQHAQLNYTHVSIVFQSSFVCLDIFARTFSNNIEAIILAWLLVVACQPHQAAVKSGTGDKSSKRNDTSGSAVIIGLIVTLGSFNRPTFPCFALAPCLFWLHGRFRCHSLSIGATVKQTILPIVLSSLLTFAAISCYDTIYYRGYGIFEAIFSDLIHLHFASASKKLTSDWVVTPYNFLAFNTNVNNLNRFGIHKPWTHILVNMPLAFNLLTLFFYRQMICGWIFGRRVNNWKRLHITMASTVVVSILLLSLIPHQEFRFLTPLLIPLVCIGASYLYNNKRLLSLWFVINLSLVYFYARVHQSGVISAALDLDDIFKEYKSMNDTRISAILSRCYPPPTYIWNIEHDDQRFHFNFQLNTMIDDFRADLQEKLEASTMFYNAYGRHKHKLFVMLPQLYVDRLWQHFAELYPNSSVTVDVVRTYSPHFSGEGLHESIEHVRKNGILEWRNAFGLSLVRVSS